MLAVLHLDSVGLAVLEPMLAEGRLPAIAGLRERGRWQALETPGSHLVAACYPTLYSGVEPGEHGVYYPFHWSAAAQQVLPPHALVQPETVWERLARAGLRALVVDAYEAPRPRLPVGACVSGFGFVNRVVLGPWSDPGSLRRLLTRRLGRSPQVDEVFGRPSARTLARFRDRLVAAPGRVVDAALELTAAGRYDLVWLSFPAAHIAGHQLWNLTQVHAREQERARALGLETGLADVYRAIDAAIGRFLESLPDDADIVAVTPLGMDVDTSRIEVLEGMVAAILSGAGASDRRSAGALWRLRSRVPTGLRAAAARALPDRVSLGLTARLATRGVDWRSTRAFVLPADHHGYVQLNVRGRERDGIVDPGDLDGLEDELAEGLSSFEDIGGGPAVRAVERTRDFFPGTKTHLLPDLVVRWNEPRPADFTGVYSPRYGLVPRNGVGSGRSGNHTTEAWALLVPGSATFVEPARQPRVCDIASTVCAVLGVDPEGLPGQSLLRAA
jgi:predicted AlkP superfamily phosphohydrolase/phosphomutase